VPVSVEVVRHLASVPRSRLFDPADRLIVATAIELGVPLVTQDAGIASSGLSECIW
jgi:PIN domain nuclease of toxin-antitoxin system